MALGDASGVFANGGGVAASIFPYNFPHKRGWILVKCGLNSAFMDPINIYEAKAKLSELVDRAAAGEEVVIARHGRPIAKLVPLAPAKGQRRKLGVLAGKVRMAKNFDAPLPDDVLAAFEGRR